MKLTAGGVIVALVVFGAIVLCVSFSGKPGRYIQVYANELGDTTYSVFECVYHVGDARYDKYTEVSSKTRREADSAFAAIETKAEHLRKSQMRPDNLWRICE